jgi:hypothetical protein
VPGRNNTTSVASARRDHKSPGRIRRTCLRAGRRKPVLRLEAHNVGDRDTIEMTADSPGGKKSRVDKLVNGLPVELPAAAQLRYCQPGGTRIRCDWTHACRVRVALCWRWMRRTSATHGCPISCDMVRTRRSIATSREANAHIVAGNTRRIRRSIANSHRGRNLRQAMQDESQEKADKVQLDGPLAVNSREARYPGGARPSVIITRRVS